MQRLRAKKNRSKWSNLIYQTTSRRRRREFERVARTEETAAKRRDGRVAAAKKQPELIDTPALRQLLANNAAPLFVDVRSASDYAAGRIPGAINLPADVLERRWNTLPKDRTTALWVGSATKKA